MVVVVFSYFSSVMCVLVLTNNQNSPQTCYHALYNVVISPCTWAHFLAHFLNSLQFVIAAGAHEKKDKSLGVMAKKFVMLFLSAKVSWKYTKIRHSIFSKTAHTIWAIFLQSFYTILGSYVCNDIKVVWLGCEKQPKLVQKLPKTVQFSIFQSVSTPLPHVRLWLLWFSCSRPPLLAGSDPRRSFLVFDVQISRLVVF